LQGVYALRRTPASKTEPLVPVVYVCHADSENAASRIHELVWNQDVVPFLLVHHSRGVRLYSGFRCQPQKDGLERGVLSALSQFNQVSELAESFHADAIDSGKLWRSWGRQVTPETRVDRKLLRAESALSRRSLIIICRTGLRGTRCAPRIPRKNAHAAAIKVLPAGNGYARAVMAR